MKMTEFFKEIAKNKILYLLALPGIVFFILFAYWPMMGIIVAFKDYKVDLGMFRSPWIGFDNFKFMFATDALKRAIINTLILNSVFILTQQFFAVMTALFLNEVRSRYFKKITQTLIFLPYFVSWIVVSVFALNLFASEGGLVNNILSGLGVEPVFWNERADLWPTILTLFTDWKNVGFLSIIYIAVITGIDPEYYESTNLDGATKMQQIKHITLPMMMPTITVMMLLAIGRIFFADFGMIYGIIGENVNLYSTTDVIDTFVFRSLRNLGDVGMSSAAGLFQSVVGFILVLGSNWLANKYQKEGALF